MKPSEATETHYCDLIDRELSSLSNNFLQMVNLGKMSSEAKDVVAREGFESELHAASMAKSIQNLLGLIAEMKQAVLVNDYGSLNRTHYERLSQLMEKRNSIQAQLADGLHEREREGDQLASAINRYIIDPPANGLPSD